MTQCAESTLNIYGANHYILLFLLLDMCCRIVVFIYVRRTP